ncbi:MAG TPA: carbon-nitrogen family hydrolase [Desulfuromonadales bacterium]|nr:carbon-nitrogen family hydrolase [Desulfuromonadales bacterium]
MQATVHAAAIQFNITLGEIDGNLAKAEEALRRVAARGAQLAVLPEMWSSGYAYRKLPELATATPRVLERLQEWSQELGMVIVGSLPEAKEDRIYNTAYVIDNGEELGRYSKMHLFSVMREDRFLAAGDNCLVVPSSVGKLGVAICYDLRFPELFRRLGLEGAEILCLPAEWPLPRQLHWRTLLRARAIENQMYVAAANCCGRQGKLDFCGMSLLIAPRGEILAEAGDTDSEIVAAFEAAELDDYRAQIPVYRERRSDLYGDLNP